MYFTVQIFNAYNVKVHNKDYYYNTKDKDFIACNIKYLLENDIDNIFIWKGDYIRVLFNDGDVIQVYC